MKIFTLHSVSIIIGSIIMYKIYRSGYFLKIIAKFFFYVEVLLLSFFIII